MDSINEPGNRQPLTPENLEATCREWQRRLRLQEWDVIPSIRRLHEMNECWGRCHIHFVKRRALIELLDTRDAEAMGEAWSWERTLVHELIHLHVHEFFPNLDDKTPEGRAAERMLEALGSAFVPD